MERSCQAQLLAEAAGTPIPIDAEMARAHQDRRWVSRCRATFNSKPLFAKIVREQPDLLD